MNWIIISKLIIEVGYPMAVKIWQNSKAGGDATQEQWNELEAMSKATAQDRMKAQLTAAGIPLDSSQAVALLGLSA
jgi:hypothetical protein